MFFSSSYLNCSNKGESNKPEPQEDVDFLVDDVQRENTETIKSLNCSRWTKFVKDAFGDLYEIYLVHNLVASGRSGHLWKHPGHWVSSLFLLQFRHGDHITAIGGELTPQEVVHEEQLPDNVEKVQKFAEEESDGVEAMAVSILNKVVHQHFLGKKSKST